MKTTLIKFIAGIANWKTLLLFLALYIFFSGYILKNAELKIDELAGKQVGVIDLTFGFHPQKTLDMVASYGDAARDYYSKIEMTADLAYPIVYAFLFSIILTLIYRNSSLAWVSILPFVNMILDYSENAFIIILLNSFPQQSFALAVLCEIFKLLKWVLLTFIVLLIVFGLISKFFNRKKTSVQ